MGVESFYRRWEWVVTCNGGWAVGVGAAADAILSISIHFCLFSSTVIHFCLFLSPFMHCFHFYQFSSVFIHRTMVGGGGVGGGWWWQCQWRLISGRHSEIWAKSWNLAEIWDWAKILRLTMRVSGNNGGWVVWAEAGGDNANGGWSTLKPHWDQSPQSWDLTACNQHSVS